MKQDLTFRTAKPADTEAAIPLIFSSGPATLDYIFTLHSNSTALDFLRKTFRKNSGQFSHTNHTVAEKEGKVVAVATSYTRREAQRYTLPMARQIISFYGFFKALGVMQRGLRVENLMPPPESGECYIAHVGVCTDLRGQGIGTALIRELFEQGKARGYRTFSLDVSVENPDAQRLYERLGFKVVEEKPSRLSNDIATVPALRRMRITV